MRVDEFDQALFAIGLSVPAEFFRTVLLEILREAFPAWSVPELLLHPKAALAFVDAARNRLNCRNIPEAVILRALRDCIAPKE